MTYPDGARHPHVDGLNAPSFMRFSFPLPLAPLVASLTFLTSCGGDSKPDEAKTQALAPPPAIEGPVLLSIRIDEDLLPLERIEKYEAPIRQALNASGLGVIRQSGAAFNEDWRVQNVVIVAQVDDVAKGVALLRKKLRELKAPENTVIQQHQPYQYSYSVYDSI
jgi:hypothetical protein